MDSWLESVRQKHNKKAIPVLGFPAVQLMGIHVSDLVKNSDLQAQAMVLNVEKTDCLAGVGLMDLSVEAECFGCEIHWSKDEIPTVVGHIIEDEEEANALVVPVVGTKRSQIYIDGIRKAKERIKDRPVFAGCIGPFSLAGRLFDVSEAMILCYEEPDMVHTVLEKVTEFIIQYIKAYKEVGADGVFMAEPLAGILSPALCDEFSSTYVKRIVEETQDENFMVIYHNCGNNTLKMIDSILSTKAKAYHFGNAISLKEMMAKIPDDVMVMGNIDPVHLKDSAKEAIIQETKQLLDELGSKENFILSTGCDIPPNARWENIEAFMKVGKEYYQG